MKYLYNLPLLLAICLMAISCNKNVTNGTASVNNLFTDTVATIKQSEPLLLSFSNGNNTTIVKWQAVPSTGCTIRPVGRYASLLFSQPGVYTVTATANTIQATYIVNISDSLYTNADTGFSLRASKLVKVLPNEAVSFTLNNPPIPSGFNWTATGNVSLANTAINPAIFGFGNGASGTVNVMVGNQTRSRTVWLANTSVNNPSLDTVPFIFFDKLTITPSVQKDGNGNKLLVLNANTGYNYQGSADSVLNLLSSDNQEFTVNYGGVVMAAVPRADVKPASCTNIINNMSVGTHPFIVNFGNDTYTGSVTLSALGVYSFSWANTNRVVISPSVVQ